MANKIQIRRGSKASLPALSVGEPGLCTDTKQIFVGNTGGNIELATKETLDTQTANKVDKIAGKGLSTNDYTTAEKTKLGGIATGATNYVHPSTHPASMITEETNKRFMTDAERSKLLGISTGANNYVHPTGTNPHGTTKTDVGLGSVLNYGIATQSEAIAGTSDVKYMTPLKVKEMLDGQAQQTFSVFNGSTTVYQNVEKDLIIPLGKIPKNFVKLTSLQDGPYIQPFTGYIDIINQTVDFTTFEYVPSGGYLSAKSLSFGLGRGTKVGGIYALGSSGSTNSSTIVKISMVGSNLVIRYLFTYIASNTVVIKNLFMEVV